MPVVPDLPPPSAKTVMNSRNSAVSKYLEAKQNRRKQARYREKRLKMGLPAAVSLKHVSLNQEEKKVIASTEVIGTARRKKLFVTRHFGWPISLGIHLFVAFLLTIYAIQEYIPEAEPVFLDFVEPVREPRKITRQLIKSVKPPDSVIIQAPRIERSAPTAVEIPMEEEQIHTLTDDPIGAGDGPTVGGIDIPEGLGDIQVQQNRPQIPTESLGPKIERDTQIAPKDTELGDISDGGLGDRTIDAEVSVQVDQRPRTLSTPDPKYPQAARRAEREGLVQLEFTVGVDGRATDFKVIKEEPKGFGFGEAAIDAVKRWRFTPAKKGGESVPTRVKIPIRFTLDDD